MTGSCSGRSVLGDIKYLCVEANPQAIASRHDSIQNLIGSAVLTGTCGWFDMCAAVEICWS